jgi:hypothetical protein
MAVAQLLTRCEWAWLLKMMSVNGGDGVVAVEWCGDRTG